MIASEGLADLVRRAQAGDRCAEDELLSRVRPELQQFASRFGDSSTAAESAGDLVQDAALRFWERFGQFHGADDDQATAAMLHDWIQQLVYRLALNRREARHAAKRRPDVPVVRLGTPATADSQGAPIGIDAPGTGATPSAVCGAAEIDAHVQKALLAIPDPADRQIVEFCFQQGLSLRAVAERLSIGYDEVRSRYHSALRFLERELEGLL